MSFFFNGAATAAREVDKQQKRVRIGIYYRSLLVLEPFFHHAIRPSLHALMTFLPGYISLDFDAGVDGGGGNSMTVGETKSDTQQQRLSDTGRQTLDFISDQLGFGSPPPLLSTSPPQLSTGQQHSPETDVPTTTTTTRKRKKTKDDDAQPTKKPKTATTKKKASSSSRPGGKKRSETARRWEVLADEFAPNTRIGTSSAIYGACKHTIPTCLPDDIPMDTISQREFMRNIADKHVTTAHMGKLVRIVNDQYNPYDYTAHFVYTSSGIVYELTAAEIRNILGTKRRTGKWEREEKYFNRYPLDPFELLHENDAEYFETHLLDPHTQSTKDFDKAVFTATKKQATEEKKRLKSASSSHNGGANGVVFAAVASEELTSDGTVIQHPPRALVTHPNPDTQRLIDQFQRQYQDLFVSFGKVIASLPV
jgi:hypothetical protein